MQSGKSSHSASYLIVLNCDCCCVFCEHSIPMQFHGITLLCRSWRCRSSPNLQFDIQVTHLRYTSTHEAHLSSNPLRLPSHVFRPSAVTTLHSLLIQNGWCECKTRKIHPKTSGKVLTIVYSSHLASTSKSSFSRLIYRV